MLFISRFAGEMRIDDEDGACTVEPRGVVQQHATLRRVLRMCFTSKCFLEGFLEGACEGFQ